MISKRHQGSLPSATTKKFKATELNNILIKNSEYELLNVIRLMRK